MIDPKLLFITNNSESSADLPKIFCCCHPDDADHLKSACDDLFAAAECVIFYYPEGAEPKTAEADDDLQHMDLFVPLISASSVFRDCFLSIHAFDIAKRYGIPVLPIMLETGLEEAFDERFGNIQCLLRNGDLVDATTVPYREKLKNALDSILNINADRRALKNAFDASVFLSYRKKDRAAAQELIKLIHEDERCRSIAIWYDEFLLPGEDFNNSIRAELEQSAAFVMAITPHITEENNYIQIVEYPLAVSLNKPVIPCEVRQTHTELVTRCFPGIDQPLSSADAKDVREAVLKAIAGTGIAPAARSPQRDLYMGIAYLNGIGTEKDTAIALSCISAAAEAGEADAMRELAAMYRWGNGVERDLGAAVLWQSRLVGLLKERSDKAGSDAGAFDLQRERLRLAELLVLARKYDEAHKIYNTIGNWSWPFREQTDTGRLRLSADAWELKAKLYISQGLFSRAGSSAIDRAVECRERVRELEHTKKAGLELAEAYIMRGINCTELDYSPGTREAVIMIRGTIPDVCVEREGHSAEIKLDLAKVPSADEYGYIVRVLRACKALCDLFNRADQGYSANVLSEAAIAAAERLASLVPSLDSKRLLEELYILDGDKSVLFTYEFNSYASAPALYEKARKLAEGLYEETGLSEYRLDIADIDLRLARICRTGSRNEEALAIYKRAYDALKELGEEMPVFRVIQLLWTACLRMSMVYYACGDKDRAYEKIKEAENTAERYARYTKQLDLTDSLRVHAQMLKQDWEMDEALIYMEKCCALLKDHMQSSGMAKDMKRYVKGLEDLIQMERMNGEFDRANELELEIDSLKGKYSDLFRGDAVIAGNNRSVY